MPQPAEPAPSYGDALLGHGHAGHLDRGEQGAGSDRRGALDVVVEGQEPVAIAVEQTPGIGACEILPLQQYMRPARHHRADEALDERVIVGAAHAFVPPADIKRIGQSLLIVGAGIEQDRQGGGGVDAGAGGVER